MVYVIPYRVTPLKLYANITNDDAMKTENKGTPSSIPADVLIGLQTAAFKNYKVTCQADSKSITNKV